MTTVSPTTRAVAPGPRGDSFISDLNVLGRTLLEYQRHPFRVFLGLQRDFGDVVRLRLGPYTIYTVTHPDLVNYVLVENHRNYTRGRWYEYFKPYFGDGLLTTDGDYWRRHRRIMQPFFHRAFLDSSVATLASETAAMLDRWEANYPPGVSFDINPETLHLALRMLGKVIYNLDLGQYAPTIEPAVRYGLRYIVNAAEPNDFIPPWVPTPYNRRRVWTKRTLERVMDDIIADRRQRPLEGNDVLSALMLARDEETGEGLSEQEIHDEAVTLFLAGHETSGTGLAWTLYLVSQHPEVRRKVEEEVDTVLGGRAPVVADLRQMTYTRMVVDESLRMCPPIWAFPRDAIEDDEIGGYHIPAGSSIFLLPYVTHRHPAFWENPEAFDPERFNPERPSSRPRFAYFPFGGGQRQCVGMHLALLELQVGLAMVSQRFRLHAVPGHPIELRPRVSLRPIHGIRMTLHPRVD